MDSKRNASSIIWLYLIFLTFNSIAHVYRSIREGTTTYRTYEMSATYHHNTGTYMAYKFTSFNPITFSDLDQPKERYHALKREYDEQQLGKKEKCFKEEKE